MKVRHLLVEEAERELKASGQDWISSRKRRVSPGTMGVE
jgi:hypothetical protein